MHHRTSRRPPGPPPCVRLRVGDHVQVTYRTSGGPAHWAGSVVESHDKLGLVTVSDGRRVRQVPVLGALYVCVLTPAAQRLDLIDGVPAEWEAHARHEQRPLLAAV